MFKKIVTWLALGSFCIAQNPGSPSLTGAISGGAPPPPSFWTGILDSNRAMDWSSVPATTTINNTGWSQCGPIIAAYTGAPTTIINAINHTGAGYTGCTTNQYIQLGTGDFHLNAAIRNVGIGNQELRGMGPQSTFLHFSAGSTCQGGNGNCLIGFESSNMNYPGGSPSFHNVTSGLSKGSTVLTLDSVSGISTGQILIMDQCDTALTGSTGSATCTGTPTDNNGLYVCEYSTMSNDRSCAFNHGNGTSAERTNRGQVEVATVTNISGLNVTIDTPLVNPNWTTGQFPQVWNMTTSGLPVKNIGITNLSIDGSSTTNTHGISFFGVGNHWVQNVVVNQLQLISIYDFQSVHGVIRSNYFYGCGQFAGNDASGINLSINGTSLIENNIFQGCINGIIYNGPGAGNVAFANYNIYAWSAPAYWAQHAAGVHYNLYEENIGGQWFSDQIHGPVMMNTLYRNAFFGWQPCANLSSGCDENTNLWPIGDLSYNRYLNIIGNVLGSTAIQGQSGGAYSVSLDNQYFTFASTGKGTNTFIYNLGSGNPGDGSNSAPWPHDPIVSTSGMRWGNWDAVHGSTQWNTGEVPSGISSFPNSVPTTQCTSILGCSASFVYSTAPEWWGNLPFPAIGPGVSSGNVKSCTGTINTVGQYGGAATTDAAKCTGTGVTTDWGGFINATPAMHCYMDILQGPLDGSGSILPFDANNCYAATHFSTLTNPASFSPPIYPVSNRGLAVEWRDLLVTPASDCNTYDFTPLDVWTTQSAAHPGSYNVYTFSHVPGCANGGGTQDVPPTDIGTTDAFYKSYVTAFMKHICGVSSAPATPIYNGCSNYKIFETWNEDNTDLYWSGTYAQHAIMDRDAAAIIRTYCADCLVFLGSTSAGGRGFHANGQTGQYDQALLTEGTAWAALSGYVPPDGVSWHPYPSRTDVTPVPFPTSIISNSSSFCTSGNTPNVHCEVAIKDQLTNLKSVLAPLGLPSTTQWIGTEGGWGLTANVCDGADCNAAHTNVIFLRAAFIAQWMIVLDLQGTSNQMWYLYPDVTWGTMASGGTPLNYYPSWPTVRGWLYNRKYTGFLTSTAVGGNNVWSVNLTVNGKPSQLIWYDGWLTNTIQATTFTTKTDIFGATTSTGGSITITQQPFLLQ